MNNQRRKALASLRDQIETLQGKFDDLRTEVESVRDEEQEAFDNMPESFQEGERGQACQSAIDALEEAVSEMENVDFDAVFASLDTACE